MKKVSLLSIIALISCLYSCNFKNNHSNETNADSVVVEKLVIADTYHLSGDTAKPACKVVLTMEIPVKYKQDSDYLHLQKNTFSSNLWRRIYGRLLETSRTKRS